MQLEGPTAAGLMYSDTGGDGPVVVLLHGVLMNGTLWDTAVEGLRDRYRCIVPELPFGAHTTPCPTTPTSPCRRVCCHRRVPTIPTWWRLPSSALRQQRTCSKPPRASSQARTPGRSTRARRLHRWPKGTACSGASFALHRVLLFPRASRRRHQSARNRSRPSSTFYCCVDCVAWCASHNEANGESTTGRGPQRACTLRPPKAPVVSAHGSEVNTSPRRSESAAPSSTNTSRPSATEVTLWAMPRSRKSSTNRRNWS